MVALSVSQILSAAATLSFLPGSLTFSVLNSFVLLIHSLGAAVDPLQGHALWCDSARHSGSFMVISLLIPVIQRQLLADVSLLTVSYVFWLRYSQFLRPDDICSQLHRIIIISVLKY